VDRHSAAVGSRTASPGSDEDAGGGRTYGEGVDATFFGLAFLAALNPKLLGIDLLLVENRRPRAMFLCFLLGASGLGITIGLLDVLLLHVDAIKTQGSLSAGLDLALGAGLLAAGAAIASGRVHARRRTSVPAGVSGGEPEPPARKESWAERHLREPRLGLAVVIGALAGTPGASYVTALKHLIGGDYSTATQVVGVVVFNLIQFSVVIVPLLLLELAPDATRRRLRATNAWVAAHARELIAGVALAIGAYMTISGLARLL
jgi:hypothetical protein